MLSNTIKQKRKEKAGKWEVPLPKVRPVAEDEMFKVLRTGKRKKKEWKRMVTKVRRQGGREAPGAVCTTWPCLVARRMLFCVVLCPAVQCRIVPCCAVFITATCCQPLPSTHLRSFPQVTFVPPGFTRKPPKYERFIRPTGLRMSKAHVTHPELKATFQLAIIGVKKNPNGQAYTGLGVITKGTCARKGACHSGSGSGSSGSGRLWQRCLRCKRGLFNARRLHSNRAAPSAGGRRCLAATAGRQWVSQLCSRTRGTTFSGLTLSSAAAVAGTIIEVNVSELGLVTPGGKVVWGKYAQG